MPIVWMRLPEISEMTSTNHRPVRCPDCGNQILQRWGKTSKSIRDIQDHDISLYRYRCCQCKRIFRDYPEGTDSSYHSSRIRQLAGIAWSMGMSSRDVVDLLAGLGICISRSTVWREGKKIINQIETWESSKRRTFTIDPDYFHKISTRIGVAIALDLGQDRCAVLGTLDEHNPRVVKSWLESLISNMNVEISVLKTGSLDHYVLSEVGDYTP